MEYPRCKTCRWWSGDPITYSDRNNDYHEVETGRRMCECPAYVAPADVNGYSLSILDPSHVQCVDASGYWAGIAPGPDHGCVHHEEKE